MNQEQEIMRNSEEEGVKDGLLESTLEAVEVMNQGELLCILRVLKADLERVVLSLKLKEKLKFGVALRKLWKKNIWREKKKTF